MKIITMSTRGRIVIPRDIRKNLAIKKGTRVQIVASDGQIILVPEKSNRSD